MRRLRGYPCTPTKTVHPPLASVPFLRVLLSYPGGDTPIAIYHCNIGIVSLWRKAWDDLTNDFLERNGSPQRIDHRSNAERGIEEIPTVHMGVAACQMEKKSL